MNKQINLKKNTIANYIGQFYTMFIGIFMLPFYIKHLGAEAYGLVGFFTMLTSIMMLLDMGFSQALTRETAKLKDKIGGLFEIKEILRSIESMILVLAIFIVIGVFFSTDWIVNQWLQIKVLSYDLVEKSIKLMGFMIAFKWYVSLYNGLIIGLEQQVWLNIYTIIIATLRFVGGLILILFISNDIFYFFMYQFIIALFEVYILNIKVYRNLPKTSFLIPSIINMKKIAPFALSLAYMSGIWIIYTQLDKLLLSHYISLHQYGYFALVVTISTAILQISNPISQAILPRMTSLLSNGRELEMLNLYRRGTQFVSIGMFSVVGIVSFYSYELLFSWSGNIEASIWAAPVLFWYAMGNGILTILAFQYYLQFAHGNLKYHLRFNTYFPFIALPIVYFAVKNYGAIGAGITWFGIQLISFLVWPSYVHNKFAPGIHTNWIFQDVFPAFIVTSIYLIILKILNIQFDIFNRMEIFGILLIIGIILLSLNILVYPYTRKIILNKIFKKRK
ncbi:MAG: oligosaccharide flippase family protein [Thiovulaceae bacterium]|nr:oligosaccharide flippase family protein [Sulfurimonadaceae bacterium]